MDICELRNLALQDEIYCALLRKIRFAEKQLDAQEKTMNDVQRNVMWEFFDLSEEINNRLLEIVCELIEK